MNRSTKGEPLMTRLRWKDAPGSDVQAPLSFGGDYVISHRWKTEMQLTGEFRDTVEYVKVGDFNLSYRPPGQHHHLGSFTSLAAAKRHAGKHHKERAVNKVESRTVTTKDGWGHTRVVGGHGGDVGSGKERQPRRSVKARSSKAGR